jgi:hypothetical protein
VLLKRERWRGASFVTRPLKGALRAPTLKKPGGLLVEIETGSWSIFRAAFVESSMKRTWVRSSLIGIIAGTMKGLRPAYRARLAINKGSNPLRGPAIAPAPVGEGPIACDRKDPNFKDFENDWIPRMRLVRSSKIEKHIRTLVF